MRRAVGNLAVLFALAAVVAFAPGGGAATKALVAAIGLAFLAGIGWFGYRIWREQQLLISSLSDGRRAGLFSAVGVIALLVAGYGEFQGAGGFLVWVALLVAAGFAIFWIVRDASRYH